MPLLDRDVFRDSFAFEEGVEIFVVVDLAPLASASVKLPANK